MMMKIDDFYDFMIYEPFMYLLTVKSDRFSQSATQDFIGMKVYTVGQSSRDPKIIGKSLYKERFRQRMFESLVLK